MTMIWLMFDVYLRSRQLSFPIKNSAIETQAIHSLSYWNFLCESGTEKGMNHEK
jgi:hypothetical protein